MLEDNGHLQPLRSRLEQAADVFANQEALHVANISPLTAIDTFNGARNGKIETDIYDDCQNISDTRAVDPIQQNLMLLDDCFLGILYSM